MVDPPGVTEPFPIPVGEDEDRINLQQYVRIVLRRKFSIFGLSLLAALLATLVASTMIPVYKSSATLLIETKTLHLVSIEQIYSIDNAHEYIQTQLRIIKSRKLAQKVIEKLKLDTNPEFLADKEAGKILGVDWSSLVPDWRAWLPEDLFPRANPVVEQVDRVSTINRVLGQFLQRLSVRPIPNTQMVSIEFAAHDRLLAAEVANAVARGYIEIEMEARLEVTASATSWLDERLKGLRGKLEQSEKALQDYREKEHLVDAGGVKTLSAEQLSDANQNLIAARQRLADARITYKQIAATRSRDGKLDVLPVVLHDPVVSTLKASEAEARSKVTSLARRYGPKHPKMVAVQADLKEAESRVQRRIQEVLTVAEKDYQAASARVASLQAILGEAKGEIQQINRKGYELGVLEREVDVTRQLYNTFLERFKETSETSGLQPVNARIVDEAVPATAPAEPNKRRIVRNAALVGLFLGILLAFLLEHLDQTLKDAGDMEARLQIPVLGVLPHISLQQRKGETPLSHIRNNPQGGFSESLRTVRTGILLSGLDQPHKILLVTSSSPQEGKTTIAATVAETLSTMHKVLLVDADLRRPALQGLFGIPKDRPGLSEFMTGTAEIRDCLFKVEDHNLFVLPAGLVPPNPLELLSSKRFAEFLQRLSETFDHIILDCAPTLAVSDALVLSTVASGVLYVVYADLTPYPLAQEGLKRLRRVHAHLIGGVLNQLPVDKKGGYGYGKYGHGKYGYYGDKYYHSYGQS
jgi:capsular exopolysaccharide synthesis family protein